MKLKEAVKLAENLKDKTEKLQTVRCMKCSKMLAKISGYAEIMCTRCKTINAFHK